MDSNGLKSVYSSASDEVWLLFLELDHESLDQPYRLVGSRENHTHNGQEYTGYPFLISLPVSDGETIPSVSLTIGNVDRLLTKTIRSIQGEISISYFPALASSPDVVQEGPFTMTLVDVRTNAMSIIGNISGDSIMSQASCDYRMTPVTTPGVFKGATAS